MKMPLVQMKEILVVNIKIKSNKLLTIQYDTKVYK